MSLGHGIVRHTRTKPLTEYINSCSLELGCFEKSSEQKLSDDLGVLFSRCSILTCALCSFVVIELCRLDVQGTNG